MSAWCHEHETHYNDKEHRECPSCRDERKKEEQESIYLPIIRDLLEDNWYLLRTAQAKMGLFDHEYEQYEDKIKKYTERFKS